MKKAYILASYRTPGCRAKKGKFKDVRPDDLATLAIKGLVERSGRDAPHVRRLAASLPMDRREHASGRVFHHAKNAADVQMVRGT